MQNLFLQKLYQFSNERSLRQPSLFTSFCRPFAEGNWTRWRRLPIKLKLAKHFFGRPQCYTRKPWQSVAVVHVGKFPFDWGGKPSGTLSMSISAVNMLMCVPPFIEIFLSGRCLKDLKPSLGKALWRKNIPVYREIRSIIASLILLWAPLHRGMDENDREVVMWGCHASAQNVATVLILWQR